MLNVHFCVNHPTQCRLASSRVSYTALSKTPSIIFQSMSSLHCSSAQCPPLTPPHSCPPLALLPSKQNEDGAPRRMEFSKVNFTDERERQ